MRIIDFHTHLDDHWIAGQPLPPESNFIDSMDRFGIEIACIYTMAGFHEDCRRNNDALAERARRHPDRLIPFATVDPKQGDAAIVQLERCLADPIFRGVKLHPWLQAFALSLVKPTLIELFRCAARHGVPVVFHDGSPPYATTYQVAAAARWVPEATVVLGHAGLSDYVVAAGQLVRDIPNLYACLCASHAGEIPYLVQTAGVEKLTFGSDFGFSDWTALAEFLDNVLEAGLDQKVLEQIMYANAARLLHLDASPMISRRNNNDITKL
jgi:uncharacterized protein